MINLITIGIAGILFMLGIISMQIASFRPSNWFVAGVLTLIFLICTGLSGLLAFTALTSAIYTP